MSAVEELQSVVCLLEHRLKELDAKQSAEGGRTEGVPEYSDCAASSSFDDSCNGSEAIVGLYLEAMNAARLDLRTLYLHAHDLRAPEIRPAALRRLRR